MTNFKTLLTTTALATLLLTSCDTKNEPNGGNSTNEGLKGDFHIAFANGTGNPSGTLVQGVSDLSQGTITSARGFQLESARTARIFPSSDGKTIWSLNYTVGSVEKLTYLGSDQYSQVARIDASIPLGTKTLRFTKINDQVGSLHYISAKAVIGEDNKYSHHAHELTIGMLDLDKMELLPGYRKAVALTLPDEYAKAGYFISRIDAPILSGGKLYYGCAVSIADPAKPTARTGLATDKAFTLVVDYNDLTKASVIATDIVRGATNGYRTPTQHLMEDGSVLQLVSGVQANGQKEVHLVKLQNGTYTSFNLNLTSLLGKQTNSYGFFYAGNGIAYIPYEDLSTERKSVGVDAQGKETLSSMWKLARVDLNKGTAIDLNVPDNLWLRQYQNAVVRNGVFYIALAPIAQAGHIYMFDVASESPTGRLGASLQGTGAEQYFIGIY